jgi:ubiquinone/menaquinone biosynthesis C-methylase UbiE
VIDDDQVSDSVTMGGHHRLVMGSRAYRLVTSRIVAPWALQGSHPHGDVLEIGAGPGAMAHHLLKVTPDLQMVVTDFDAEMCTTASEALERFASRVVVEQADAKSLPFGDESFDYVLSFLMLHHTGDWPQALREAMRVLRPGGQLVGFDILAGAPLHHGRDFEMLLKRGDLEQFFATLPVKAQRVRLGLAGWVVRFVAIKK